MDPILDPKPPILAEIRRYHTARSQSVTHYRKTPLGTRHDAPIRRAANFKTGAYPTRIVSEPRSGGCPVCRQAEQGAAGPRCASGMATILPRKSSPFRPPSSVMPPGYRNATSRWSAVATPRTRCTSPHSQGLSASRTYFQRS